MGLIDRSLFVHIVRMSSATVIIGLAIVLCGCLRPAQPYAKRPTKLGEELARNIQRANDLLKLPSDILSRCKQATVLIGNFENGELTSTGSGVVCDDGKTILTNKHVVTGHDDRVDDCKLLFFSGTEKARIVQVSALAITTFDQAKSAKPNYHELDIAAIRIPEKIAEPLVIGEAGAFSETDAAWAFGFPQGTRIRTSGEDMPTPTVHVMRIERIHRKKEKVKVLQLSGSPTYGDSGGPIVSRSGQVVAVLQAKAEAGSSIVYGLPSAAMTHIMSKAKDGKLVARQWLEPIRGRENHGSTNTGAASARRDPKPKLVGRSVLSRVTLTAPDLEGLTARELTITRNEPFARRGYIFRRDDLRAIFSQFSWYVPRTRNLAAVQRMLTKLEARNVDFIRVYQRANGLEW